MGVTQLMWETQDASDEGNKMALKLFKTQQ